jgi:biopolymer transport protein ExbD
MTQIRHVEDHLLTEINITPFTDVLLVLLIIFMILAALVAPPGFQKQLGPPPNGGPSGMMLHQIEIDVARSGRITIDGEPTTAARLYADVAAAVRSHEHRRGFTQHIALVADKDAAYDAIIKVLDAARQAGDNDVGFVTY